MAYMSQEKKAKIAPKVKEILKRYGIKGRLGVNNHSTLVLNDAPPIASESPGPEANLRDLKLTSSKLSVSHS